MPLPVSLASLAPVTWSNLACKQVLAGELVRRVSGQTVGTFLRERIALPHDLDMHIGIPEEMDTRVADLVAIYASKLEFNTTFFSRCAAASARVRSATLLQRPRAERLHAQASPAVVDAVAALDSDATTVDGAAAAR